MLFGQRARRRPAVGVGRVPSLGPHHRGVEEERAAVVRAVVMAVVTAVFVAIGAKAGEDRSEEKSCRNKGSEMHIDCQI